ncbi:MAG: S8 family serine peptidase [Methylotenera sp.]|nr:S8 family serine peptidase [Oligoflexia bacterium]
MDSKKNLISPLSFLALLVTACFFCLSAYSGEYLVRMHEPQNSPEQAQASAIRAGFDTRSEVQVLNSEEGLIRVVTPGRSAFKSDLESNPEVQATPELVAGPDFIDTSILKVDASVLSITRNFHHYRPAIHYSFHEVNHDSLFGAVFEGWRSLMIFLSGNSVPPVGSVPAQSRGADTLVAQDYTLSKVGFSPTSAVQSNVIAAVIDTGVDYNHEDLAAAMWRKPGSGGKVVGHDFVHDTETPYDLVNFNVPGCMKDPDCRDLGIGVEKYMSNPGHGTHCSGRLGAVFNNSRGLRGVGAGSKIMALKFFADVGDPNPGEGDDAAAIKSIDYAIKNGVKVISASWGGRQARVSAEASELKQALVRAQKAGVIVVIAAGNDRTDQDTAANPSYPAAYDLDNLIVVAATDRFDTLASFSSYGAKTVHIAAPGVKILSTVANNPVTPPEQGAVRYSDEVAKYTDQGGKIKVMDWSGTSMATPTVAGAVALVWSQFPREDYHQIRNRILSSARKVTGLSGRVSSGGVLDVAGALRK